MEEISLEPWISIKHSPSELHKIHIFGEIPYFNISIYEIKTKNKSICHLK